MARRVIVIEADDARKLDEFMEDVESMGYDVRITEQPEPGLEGMADHDDEDRRAYREELNRRPRPSDY